MSGIVVRIIVRVVWRIYSMTEKKTKSEKEGGGKKREEKKKGKRKKEKTNGINTAGFR